MLNKQTNKIIGIVALVLLVILAIGYMTRNYSTDSTESITKQTTEWFKGGEEAKVILTEYSDFQCPACRAYDQLLVELSKEFGDDLKITYKHFPLKQIHFNANLAAQAAEAAGLQNNFWEMHDKLFTEQKQWSESRKAKKFFTEYATAMGLDVGEFQKDINSRLVKNKVNEDYTSGLKLKINYTPYFLLNNKKIENPQSYEEFKSIIEKSIKDSS